MPTPYDDAPSQHTLLRTQLCLAYLNDHSARIQCQSSALLSGHLSVLMMLMLSMMACQIQSSTSKQSQSESLSASKEHATLDSEDADKASKTTHVQDAAKSVVTKSVITERSTSETPSALKSVNHVSSANSNISVPDSLSLGQIATGSSGEHVVNGGMRALGLQGVGRGGGGSGRGGLGQLDASGSGSTPAVQPQARATTRAEAPRREAGPESADRKPEESEAQYRAHWRFQNLDFYCTKLKNLVFKNE